MPFTRFSFFCSVLALLFLSGGRIYAQIPNYVPLSGLQGYWPFTGNANDLGGNNYNGTVNGAVLTTDRFGAANCAYSFNGGGNYISTNYAGILGSGARAVSFWAKTSTTASGMAAVAWGSNTQASRFDCYFNYAGQGATFDSGYGAITYNSSNYADNNWHHYVYQFNGSTINQVDVYKDGILLTQVVSSYNPSNVINTLSTFSVQFGRMVYSSPDYFKGQLDDIGIWNRKLTMCEIQQLYTSSLPTVSVTGGTIVCRGQSSILTASGASNYSWTTGANTASISVNPSSTTAYTVTGIVNGCSAQGVITVSVNSCTGIASLPDIKTGFSLYPNPTNGLFILENPGAPANVEIYNSLGARVYAGHHEVGSISIDLGTQAKGVYIVRLLTTTHAFTNRLIVE